MSSIQTYPRGLLDYPLGNFEPVEPGLSQPSALLFVVMANAAPWLDWLTDMHSSRAVHSVDPRDSQSTFTMDGATRTEGLWLGPATLA